MPATGGHTHPHRASVTPAGAAPQTGTRRPHRGNCAAAHRDQHQPRDRGQVTMSNREENKKAIPHC